MIDRRGTSVRMVCDDCGDTYGDDKFDQHEFPALLAAAKADSWVVKPDKQGGWWHSCPDCSGSTLTPLERARKLLG
jgi:predicted RNA-binding Zn-ribbon protein involved in translation (DUF1610 family)